jgi:integrase
LSKSDAKALLAEILAPINARARTPSRSCTLGEFVKDVYLPFYHRKWKQSTIMTNDDRVNRHLVGEFGGLALGDFSRDGLQNFLDRKAAAGLSFSVVAHLRWDLRQVFGMAVADGYIARNPAAMLFTPRECPRPNTPVMAVEEVNQLISILDLRERLIVKLAILAGMRPGEIFGLTWGRLEREYADVQQRVYRGIVDTPKSHLSVRWAALSDGLLRTIEEWRQVSIATDADHWVFPSEKMTTPLAKDNCWRRHVKPKLEAVGLGWVDFHVMRRTHSCLLKGLDVDPKVRADQMGHSVDVNENVYTRASLDQRLVAVNALESSLKVM